MKAELKSLAQLKRTPRKSSVETSYREKFCEKLRSNSSFKKERPRADEYSPSPTAFRDRSASKSRPNKSISRTSGIPTPKAFNFVPLVRKNTKNSDTIGYAPEKKGIEFETEDFFSCLAKSTKQVTIDKFDSKGTLSIGKSLTVDHI